MASFLYRIGHFSYRHKLAVIGVWVLLLIGAGVSTTLAKPFLLDFNLPGSETERAGQMLDAKFPGQGDMELTAQAKVVMKAPTGTTLDDPGTVAAVDRLVSGLRGLDDVAAPETVANPVNDPLRAAQVNRDRTTAYVHFMLTKNFVDVDAQDAFPSRRSPVPPRS